MIPKYKIEIYTGTTLDYTITDDAISIIVKDRLTDSVGQFAIELPSDKHYEDIVLYDKVKIYLGNDTLPTNPNFIGYIDKIGGQYGSVWGHIRKISGLALGEVLLRRFKCGHYSGATAHNIVDEFCSDLTLGTGEVGAEANTPNFEFMNESYFEAMQRLSDYWVNAGAQLKKEFYVDTNSALVYKDRPLRTTGVETLTLGTNIESYAVTRSLENVKNNIAVYGTWDELFTAKNPSDENWTEPDATLTNWTAVTGTLARDGVDFVQGAYSVDCTSAGAGIVWDVDFYRNLKPEYAFVTGNSQTITHSFSRIHYQQKGPSPSTNDRVVLHAPDTANYFWRSPGHTNAWATYDITLPTTDAVGVWTAVGTPQANYITGIGFKCHATATFDFRVDDLALQGGRFVYKVNDATSITNYGQRDHVVVDELLQSNAQCESRARTLLYQLKDPITQVEICTTGNTNILKGDRLTLTIPRESITAGSFDVLAVDHSLTADAGFRTKLTAVDTASLRYMVSQNSTQQIVNEISKVKQSVRSLFKKVR